MNSKIFYILICCVSLSFIGCSNTIDDYQTYLKYLADKDNGLLKEKNVAGINMKVKYLPAEYLVYNEINKTNQNLTKEEVYPNYSNSLTFMLTLGPDENETFDITKVGVSNYEEFSVRIEEMNFNMGSYVKLQVGDKEYIPILSQMESLYGLEKKRNILFVFGAKDENGNAIAEENDLKFIYSDELFNTGKNKFLFKKTDIEALPEFIF